MKVCEFCNQPIQDKRPSNLAKRKYCLQPCRCAALRVKDITAHFWGKVKKTDNCWIWCGSYWDTRYGSFRAYGKVYLAHRFAYRLTYGDIPQGLFVCHSCDNPKCVRPDHLFLGTPKDNAVDRMRKGRGATGDRNGARTHPEKVARGELSHISKLNAEKVREARRRYAAGGITIKELGVEYGVCKATMRELLRRITWKHITD